ncbi:hypothetical protein OIU78_026491 [Salix suchowensis]|nr:hypothetical protein OIU78_026491 [Salix suchowensis]
MYFLLIFNLPKHILCDLTHIEYEMVQNQRATFWTSRFLVSPAFYFQVPCLLFSLICYFYHFFLLNE